MLLSELMLIVVIGGYSLPCQRSVAQQVFAHVAAIFRNLQSSTREMICSHCIRMSRRGPGVGILEESLDDLTNRLETARTESSRSEVCHR